MRGWFENRMDRRPAGFRKALLCRTALGVALGLVLVGRGTMARTQGQGRGRDAEMEAPSPVPPPPSSKSKEVPPPPAGMTFTTHLEHTAVWVGDQFHYTIIVDHTPNYEFVLDTMSKETVNMDPFQVMEVSKRTLNLKNSNRRLYVDLMLTTFATGKANEQIPQLTLFYFKRERGVLRAQEAAAESLTVPGPVIGLRTTLPPGANDIRDAVSVSSWPQSRWVLAFAGTFSLILIVAGIGWETVALIRRRKSQRGPDRRKAMLAVRERWLSSVPGDFANTETAIRFYDQSYQDLKEYVGHYLELATAGLTASELDEEMGRLGTDRDLREKTISVLGTLETVRYSQNGAAPTPEAAQRMAQDLREIFAFGSRR